MKQLNMLFNEIKAINRFAIPVLVNQDDHYYYYKINGGWITEISKKYLNNLKNYKLYSEAKYILDNY